MHKNESGNAPKSTLEVTLPYHTESQRNNVSRLSIDSVLALSVFLLLEMTFISMFQINSIHFLSLIPGMIILLLLFYVNKRTILMVSITVISIIIGIMLLGTNIFEGLLTILNEVYATIGMNTGRNFPIYELSESGLSQSMKASIFWLFMSIFIALLIFYISKTKSVIIYILLAISVYLFQFIFNVQPHLLINIGLFLLILLQIIKSYTIGKNRTVIFGRKVNTVICTILGFLMIIFSISIALILYLSPVSTYEKNTFANQIKKDFVSVTENARYEKDNTSVLTQGDFTKLSDLNFPENQALEVVMDEPSPLYLKGYVGSTYTSERWEDLDSDVYYENHGLFYWLNDAGFNPLNQLSIIEEVTKLDVGDHSEVTIQNIHANSKYLYIPYELSSIIDNPQKTNKYDQSHIKSTELFGSRLYNYEIQTELVEKYPTLANAVYSKDINNKTKEYLLSESHYNEYVYERYTEVPEDVTEILNNSLEESIEETEDHIPYEVAIDTIQTYLYETINYKIDPEQLPKEQDFMTHLLEDSLEGYSTHFATAGTLMFRHVGIPARYVEGYLVTPKDTEDKDSYEKIEISEENAHAWTEIYIDKVGWLPIEVTPPYFDVMPETDLSDYPTGEKSENQSGQPQGGSSGGQDEKTKEISDVDQDEENSEQEEKENIWKKYLLLVLLILIIMILIAIIVYIIRKRLRLRRLKAYLHDPNANIAAKRMFSYSLSLLHYDGLEERGGSPYTYEADISNKYGQDFADKFTQAITLNQIAIYSNQDITADERNKMEEFMQGTIEHVIQSKNLLQRLKMKYWDFIY